MFSYLFLILSTITMVRCTMSEYFPKIKDDLTQLSWEHAVNNQNRLTSALESSANMLEADVTLGMLKEGKDNNFPIMAHPPENISDLSLEVFMSTVNTHNMKNPNLHKGVKLDFKSIAAFNGSIKIIKKYLQELKPVWLNADILPGPVNATIKPVNPEQFFAGCKEFSNITLSIGWTTNFNTSYAGEHYTEQQIKEMISTINTFKVDHAITFPVRAGLAAESLDQMKILTENISDSTLTIWSSEDDPVDVVKLKSLILNIGLNKVYVDVPKNLSDKLALQSAGNHLGKVGIFSVLLSTLIMLLTNIFL